METARPLIDQRKHELTVSLPTDPIWLHADASRLEQVVTNLLTNAAKYTNEGGHIWLSAKQEGDKAVLRVRDTGLGIAPAFLPHVFDVLTQAERSSDRSQGGLGLGLTLAKRLVEMHGGTIGVSSTLGEGSEFVVSLVACPPAAMSLTTRPPPTKIAQSTGAALRVLVVDDNVCAAKILEMLVEGAGHLVRMAHTGPTALTAALDYRPDVMLLDLGLPELDGWEVARRIRQTPLLHDIVLVAITGYGQESVRQRSLEAGFDYHFAKPADFEKVRQILMGVAEKANGMPTNRGEYPHQVNEELVTAMAKAGCVEVSLGFESGCPQVLRAMNKRFQPQEVREISERLAALGIRRLGFLLLGGPGETKESVAESFAFARSLGLEMLKVSTGIRLYPHTPLARQAVEEGVVSPEDDLLTPRFYIRPGLEDYIREIQGGADSTDCPSSGNGT